MDELERWEKVFQDYLSKKEFSDGSHSLGHFKRVWKLASRLTKENEDRLTILAACYFHDIVSYPKNHPDRSKSSVHAALKTEKILNEMNFPQSKIENVKHCIEAHSFSAGIKPITKEAKIVQDADRMEALGAIGLARTFYVAGRVGSNLFHDDDPMAEDRELDDTKYAFDHFKVKLLKLPETMQTKEGKKEAIKRADVLVRFAENLKQELSIT